MCLSFHLADEGEDDDENEEDDDDDEELSLQQLASGDFELDDDDDDEDDDITEWKPQDGGIFGSFFKYTYFKAIIHYW